MVLIFLQYWHKYMYCHYVPSFMSLLLVLKVVGILLEEATLPFSFLPPLYKGISSLKKKNLLLFFFLRADPRLEITDFIGMIKCSLSTK